MKTMWVYGRDYYGRPKNPSSLEEYKSSKAKELLSQIKESQGVSAARNSYGKRPKKVVGRDGTNHPDIDRSHSRDSRVGPS